jgi:hypothetical protein
MSKLCTGSLVDCARRPDPARLATAERHALAFLNGQMVLQWAVAELGQTSP